MKLQIAKTVIKKRDNYSGRVTTKETKYTFSTGTEQFNTSALWLSQRRYKRGLAGVKQLATKKGLNAIPFH